MSGVHVSLVAVQEDVLAKLVAVAVSDACADEVTAPMTPGEAWTAERVAWLEDYHRACRAGLDSPVGEATWAVIHEGAPVGAVRLKRTDEPSTLETGIWLAQNVRGQRLAEAALTLVLARARACGAASVRAETSATNTPARALLDRLGFVSAEPDRNGRVSARCDLDPAFPALVVQVMSPLRPGSRVLLQRRWVLWLCPRRFLADTLDSLEGPPAWKSTS